MHSARWIGSIAALVGVMVAVAQQSSTSSAQARNGNASASSSASSSSMGRGQGGRQVANGMFAAANGVTAKPTHVVTYRIPECGSANVSVREIDADLRDRENQYWSRLAQNGKLVMAGFWREKDGATALLSTQGDREAMQLLQSDPMIKAGAAYEVRAWEVSVIGPGSTQSGPANQSSQNNRSESTNAQQNGQTVSSGGG